MLDIFNHFHFIRPHYLWLLLPFTIASWILFHSTQKQNSWKKYIDQSLLKPLLKNTSKTKSLFNPILLILYWLITCLALAGPSWEKIPQSVVKRDDGLVILFDLSPSMLVEDIKPSRFITARRKIFDLLKEKKEGYTALIAYSGDAHIVSPLSDDKQTIINLLNTLDPGIMPVYGSNTEHAFQLAIELFYNAGFNQGDILLITDGVTEQAAKQVSQALRKTPFSLTVIGVGTTTGGPIPQQGGNFIKDTSGNIILPQLNRQQLIDFAGLNAGKNNGRYWNASLDNRDITHLINPEANLNQKNNTQSTEREFDQWKDRGAFIAPLLLILLLPLFRRGALFSLIIVSTFLFSFLFTTSPAHSADNAPSNIKQAPSLWDQLWLNKNQQGKKAYKQQNYKNASELFRDPQWQASAHYENGDYQQAIEQFKQDKSATGQYNLGNSLAKAGDLQGALDSYEKSLSLDPSNTATKQNKETVEKMLEEQQKQQQENQDQGDNKEEGQENSQENNEESSEGESQSSDQKTEQDSDQDSNQNSQQEKSEKNPEESSEENSEESPKENPDEDSNPKESPPSEEQLNPEEINPKNKEQGKEQQAQEDNLQPQDEQQQALEQWLRTVPDDPSGLLRNKFNYYYQQRRQEAQRGRRAEHLNEEQRW